MKRRPSQAVVVAVVAIVLLVGSAGAYFLLVSPQRSKAAELERSIESTRAEIQRTRRLALERRNVKPIRVADLFRLTKAMPDEPDMPGVLLELDRVARQAGIEFESIAPQGKTAGTAYQAIPISLVFEGNYFELADFLFRLRNLVSVHGGRLESRGRLFLVDSVDFGEGEKKFPQIQANLTVTAFVYGTGTTPAAPGAAATTPPASPAPPAPPAPPAATPPPAQPPANPPATAAPAPGAKS